MTIETKFDIGDTVWFMLSNKVTSARINNWSIDGNNGSPYFEIYYMTNRGVSNGLDSKLLYKSKEELIASL